jgi:hypothetical protein
MKKFSPLYIFFTTLLLVTAQLVSLTGCEERTELDMCRTRRTSGVSRVEGPSTGQVNQNIAITAYVTLAGNCSGFERFTQTTSGNTQTITANTYTNTCVACTQNFFESPAVYAFKASKPGTYYLKFASFNDQYVTDTLVVK